MPRKRPEPTRTSTSTDGNRRPEEDVDWQGFPWLSSAVAVLFTARFFLPAESAAHGETLWITLLWLVCGVLWLVDAFRRGESLRRPDWLDSGLLLLVGGHVVSAIGVLVSAGDKRSALNMLWEWVGIGVAGLLIRAVMREHASRERLLSCLLASGVVLSGLGIWQHYVWYPSIAGQFAELDRLEQSSRSEEQPLTVEEHQRLTRLQQELGVSGDGADSSQRSLRDRIQASTEPIGRFALANTLAGLLIVALLLALACVPATFTPQVSPLRIAVIVLIVCALGYCLILTKSRTAMVGLMCGLFLGLVILGRTWLLSRWGRWSASGVGLGIVALVLIAALSGGLDREVISETPKSLRYRFEYWTATGDVIREHPLLGVGPGNFRQSYLKHKLPESSEEILDPHNFVLDVWANGGLIALTGLVCLLLMSARIGLNVMNQSAVTVPTDEQGSAINEIMLRVAIGSLAMILAALVELFQGTDIRSDWLSLAAAWWSIVVVITLMTPSLTQGRFAVLALVGILIHLTGAGGIAMPAILQVVLVLVFAAEAQSREPVSRSDTFDSGFQIRRCRSIQLAAIVVGLAAIVACGVTAALPVTKSNMALLEADAALNVSHNPLVAERACLLAGEIDRLSPAPWHELAIVRAIQWRQRPTDSAFASTVESIEQAIALDPMSFGGWRALSDLWWERFERSGETNDAVQSLSASLEAVDRYPHHAILQANVARAADAAGQPDVALEWAKRSLDQDALNREFGHADKILPPELSVKLRKIVNGADSVESE
ncbi:MAG: O-antigen ligase family protein [Planctomycetaceae bacterium]|nr:O-antigen ligase family protein [Planctomycetaceae bacterium]